MTSSSCMRWQRAADRSYGVQVARLAGLPEAVVNRARDVLHQLEAGETSGKARLIDDLAAFCVMLQQEKPKPRDAGERQRTGECGRCHQP